jgi:hypothetical protein
MALRFLIKLLRDYWWFWSPSLVMLVGFLVLFQGAKHRHGATLPNPRYYQDPRAPRVCMCLWERSAFRVPCEDIPPELLKEAK